MLLKKRKKNHIIMKTCIFVEINKCMQHLLLSVYFFCPNILIRGQNYTLLAYHWLGSCVHSSSVKCAFSVFQNSVSMFFYALDYGTRFVLCTKNP